MKVQSRSTEDIWISGINPVIEALRAESMPIREMILARTDQRILEITELARRKGLAVRQESRDSLSALLGHAHHQGVALRAGEYPYMPLESLLSRGMEERDSLVILDCIQDPQNLGALIRSACFLGAGGIVIPQDRSARITSTVIKVAAGATSYLPVIQVTNLARALERLKDAGTWIVGLDVDGKKSLYEADLTVPVGIVVGNEQKGIRQLIRKHCDLLVQIPARGPFQSLNASAAGAIALAEVQRQRSERRIR